jgi:hypothetical protein
MWEGYDFNAGTISVNAMVREYGLFVNQAELTDMQNTLYLTNSTYHEAIAPVLPPQNLTVTMAFEDSNSGTPLLDEKKQTVAYSAPFTAPRSVYESILVGGVRYSYVGYVHGANSGTGFFPGISSVTINERIVLKFQADPVVRVHFVDKDGTKLAQSWTDSASLGEDYVLPPYLVSSSIGTSPAYLCYAYALGETIGTTDTDAGALSLPLDAPVFLASSMNTDKDLTLYFNTGLSAMNVRFVNYDEPAMILAPDERYLLTSPLDTNSALRADGHPLTADINSYSYAGLYSLDDTQAVQGALPTGLRQGSLTLYFRDNNTHTAFTYLTVDIIWDDKNNTDKLRPQEVLVELLLDGKPVQGVAPLIISAQGGWTNTFYMLPVPATGSSYSVRELPVPNGYIASYVPAQTIYAPIWRIINVHSVNTTTTPPGPPPGQNPGGDTGTGTPDNSTTPPAQGSGGSGTGLGTPAAGDNAPATIMLIFTLLLAAAVTLIFRRYNIQKSQVRRHLLH